VSVERRINIPNDQQFAGTVEQLKIRHRVDDLLAQYIWSSLSDGAQAATDLTEIVDRVRREIDPELVRTLHDLKFKSRPDTKAD